LSAPIAQWGDVVVMADPVHQDAASVGTMASPPAMMPGSHVRQFRSGAGPLVVIEMVGWRDNLRVALRFVIAGRQAYFDTLNRSEDAASNQLDGAAKFRTRPLLAAGLEDSFLISDFTIDKLSFVKRVRDRLFAVNVFSVSQSFKRAECVPVVGRGDDNGIDIVA
jgi:hypothetical protein